MGEDFNFDGLVDKLKTVDGKAEAIAMALDAGIISDPKYTELLAQYEKEIDERLARLRQMAAEIAPRHRKTYEKSPEPSECPDDYKIWECVDGQMAEKDEARVLTHTRTCNKCGRAFAEYVALVGMAEMLESPDGKTVQIKPEALDAMMRHYEKAGDFAEAGKAAKTKGDHDMERVYFTLADMLCPTA